ncbi:MAG: hypothetical protein AB7V50_07145 [Vampirovibrionia bacterium]
MHKLELSKYPRNIFIPVVLLIIGMLLVFILYKIHSVNIQEVPQTQLAVKLPLNTKADFIIETNIIASQHESKDLVELNLSGDSVLNIDLSNGAVLLDSLNLKPNESQLVLDNQTIKKLSVNLNSSYPSTGKIDLKTGTMDISLDLLLKYVVSQENVPTIKKQTTLTISLSGNIDRKAGIIKLFGEATVPPGKDSQPVPIKIQVVATTDPVEKEVKQ